MKKIYEKIRISPSDFDELNSENGRWTKETFAYWAAKFLTSYPPEGYDLFDTAVIKDEKGKCYITWAHYDSCD